MSVMFETTEINGMKLANRFIRSATWEGMAAEDGSCTPKLVKLIAGLAKGGVGLIISGHTYVQKRGQALKWQMGVSRDEHIKGLCTMSRAVHDNGGKIFLQIAHAGLYAHTELINRNPLAPSMIEGLSKYPYDEVTTKDIHEIIESFVEAAQRAKEAGFDGIQIHSAHGYLLSQFLSPFYNRRNDEYGSSVKGRARILLDIIKKVKSAVGKRFPVLIKMNCNDFLEGGLTQKDSLKTAMLLQDAGIDGIELSGGTQVSGRLGPVRMGIVSEKKEAYFLEGIVSFKKTLSVPVILVGGIRSFQLAEKIVHDGHADYISMSRPFIREPDLINRWASGDLKKATCISDCRCFPLARAGKGLVCEIKERTDKTKR